MVESRLLVRIDVLLGLFALLVVLAAFYLIALRTVVGAVALAVVSIGLYALFSYGRGFLLGTAEPSE